MDWASIGQPCSFLMQVEIRLGVMLGLGRWAPENARAAWTKDLEAKVDFDAFLTKLQQDELEETPVFNVIKNMSFDTKQDDSVFSEVLQTRRRKHVAAVDAATKLPAAFIEQYKVTDYEILPLHSESKVFGLVVVDNLHNQKPISKLCVDRLKMFLLNQAALTLQNLVIQRAQSTLIMITHQVMSEAGVRPLIDTLKDVCKASKELTGADFVCIYTLKENSETPRLDPDYFASDDPSIDLQAEKSPRPDGLTASVLSSKDPLLIGDIHEEKRRFAGEPFVKTPIFNRP